MGISSVEVVTALVVFSITLLGLVSTAMTHLRLVASLEQRATVLMPPTGTLTLLGYDPATGQIDRLYEPDVDTSLVSDWAVSWANRLGAFSLSTHDIRPDPGSRFGRFPTVVGCPFAIEWGGVLETVARQSRVSLTGGIVDDGESITASIVLTPP